MLSICNKCLQAKESDQFYTTRGVPRSECKKCTIRRNVRHQRKIKAWLSKSVDVESRKEYMREYYEKNKEKYVTYRNNFRKKHPYYYVDYFRRKKNKR